MDGHCDTCTYWKKQRYIKNLFKNRLVTAEDGKGFCGILNNIETDSGFSCFSRKEEKPGLILDWKDPRYTLPERNPITKNNAPREVLARVTGYSYKYLILDYNFNNSERNWIHSGIYIPVERILYWTYTDLEFIIDR